MPYTHYNTDERNALQAMDRASAFTFSTPKFLEKQHALKKKFTAKSKKSKKKGKKGPENKNLRDYTLTYTKP